MWGKFCDCKLVKKLINLLIIFLEFLWFESVYNGNVIFIYEFNEFLNVCFDVFLEL